jgi:hypothetical protein
MCGIGIRRRREGRTVAIMASVIVRHAATKG